MAVAARPGGLAGGWRCDHVSAVPVGAVAPTAKTMAANAACRRIFVMPPPLPGDGPILCPERADPATPRQPFGNDPTRERPCYGLAARPMDQKETTWPRTRSREPAPSRT